MAFFYSAFRETIKHNDNYSYDQMIHKMYLKIAGTFIADAVQFLINQI